MIATKALPGLFLPVSGGKSDCEQAVNTPYNLSYHWLICISVQPFLGRLTWCCISWDSSQPVVHVLDRSYSSMHRWTDIAEILATARSYQYHFGSRWGNVIFKHTSNAEDSITTNLKRKIWVHFDEDLMPAKVGAGAFWRDICRELDPKNMSATGLGMPETVSQDLSSVVQFSLVLAYASFQASTFSVVLQRTVVA